MFECWARIPGGFGRIPQSPRGFGLISREIVIITRKIFEDLAEIRFSVDSPL